MHEQPRGPIKNKMNVEPSLVGVLKEQQNNLVAKIGRRQNDHEVLMDEEIKYD